LKKGKKRVAHRSAHAISIGKNAFAISATLLSLASSYGVLSVVSACCSITTSGCCSPWLGAQTSETLSTPRIGGQEVSDEGNNGSRSRMDSDRNCVHPIFEQSYCICDKLHAGPTTTATRECPVLQVQCYKPYSRPPLRSPQLLKTEGKWTRFSDLCSLCSGESDEEERRSGFLNCTSPLPVGEDASRQTTISQRVLSGRRSSY
jgi:hypothetical protein